MALRGHRTGFLLGGTLACSALLAPAATFTAAAGSTPGDRAVFGLRMQAIANEVAYILPLPIQPETIGGYLQWRGYGLLSIIFGIWALLAASGARADEECGLVDFWLAAGLSRPRLIATRFAAFLLAAAAAIAVTAAGGLLGAAATGGWVAPTRIALASLPLLGLAAACYGIAMAAAQLTGGRRAAATTGGGVLLALFLLDSLGRIRTEFHDWSRVSPFALYDSTTALAPGGRFDVPATAALFAIATALAILTAVAFRCRDVGAPLLAAHPRRRAGTSHRSAGSPLLGLPVLGQLYEQRATLLVWGAGTMLLAAFFLSLARAAADIVRSVPSFHAYFRSADTSDPTVVLLGLFWFGFAGFLLVAYAITQVARWAAEDANGRLEMMLAQPVARWWVVAERGLALTVATAMLAGVGSIVIAAGAPGQDMAVDPGRLLLATGLLVPLALTFGALGAATIARLPRVAVGALAVVATFSFLIGQFGPLLGWPEWALDLSVFRLYGTPLSSGLYATGIVVMLAVVAGGFATALVVMRFRDVGR
jgi:ABC-2 type transport system permease protein